MLESALQILKMTGEGAVLVQRGRVVFANSDAQNALGADCVGRRASELFGEVVSGVQSPFFLAQVRLGDKPYQLRIAQLGGEQVYFLRPQEELPAVLNQPFLYALRSALMNQQVAAEQMRGDAEDLRSEPLLQSLSAITRSQFQILRILNNASLILSLSEGTAVCSPAVFSLSSLCRSVLDAAFKAVKVIRVPPKHRPGICRVLFCPFLRFSRMLHPEIVRVKFPGLLVLSGKLIHLSALTFYREQLPVRTSFRNASLSGRSG